MFAERMTALQRSLSCRSTSAISRGVLPTGSACISVSRRLKSGSCTARARFSISDSGLVPALSGDRAAIDQLGLNEPTLQPETRPAEDDQTEHAADHELEQRPAAAA